MFLPAATRRICLALLGAAVLLAMPARAQESQGAPPIIAAASSLQFPLAEIADAFQAQTGLMVRLSYGSSGNIARQIRQGAPFALFMAADEAFVLDLARDGLTRDEGVVYAEGRLALLVPNGSPLKADGTLEDLRAALADGRLDRLAIANPEHAPYGRAAEQALRHSGLWDALQPKLVLGENVAQAAQFATSGNVDGGIVGLSLAVAPRVAALGTYALIPPEWHRPLLQRMALLKPAGDTAERFYAFLQQPPARAILDRYGLPAPGESR